MRQRILLFLLASALFPACAHRDASSEVNALLSEKNYPKALEVSLKWQSSEPENPEAYVAVTNAYFQLAVQEAPASPRSPGNADTSLVDPTTGKPAVNIAPPVQYEPGRMRSAVDNLEAAVGKFPGRLDLWLGLAYLYQREDDFSNEYATLTRALQYATAFPGQLKWFKDQALPKPPEILVPESMQDYCVYIRDRLKPRWDDYAKLSELTAEYYPNHPFAFDNLGNYYLLRKDWDRSEKNYLKARELAPTDGLILNNLANLYLEKKEFSKAKAAYQKTIAASKDPGAAAEAVEKLRKIEQLGY